MSGVTKIVNNLSFLFSILRALIMAGTAQAKPLTMGITLFPLSPTLRMSLSLKKLMRAIYPLSSSMVISPNKIMICGTKTKIPLRPATNPLMIKLLHHASGSHAASELPPFAKAHSIPSMGKLASQ